MNTNHTPVSCTYLILKKEEQDLIYDLLIEFQAKIFINMTDNVHLLPN